MMFQPKNRFLWDFWTHNENGTMYLFYLSAPITKDANERHKNARVALATTTDLINWDDYGDIFLPSEDDSAWDNKTIWTGSVIKKDNLYYLFYTGTNKTEFASMQRVGLGVSSDLIHWERITNSPLLEVDTTYYATHNQTHFGETAWRDPFVFYNDDKYHMLITAERNDIAPEHSGTLAHFVSNDLKAWEVQKPFLECENFGQMECPQIVRHGDWYYLLISAAKDKMQRTDTKAQQGTYYFASKQALSGYEYRGFLAGGDNPEVYISKIITHPKTNEFHLMGWRGTQKDGTFAGTTTVPIKLNFNNKTGEIQK